MEYQRFVSYVYKYHGKEKGENCGFVKVERKQNMVRLFIHMYLPEKMDETYQIYGFVRENGVLNGYLLGSGRVRYGNVDVRMQREQENLTMEEEEQSKLSFDRLSGMIITSSGHENFGTVWDEEELVMEQFREVTPESVSDGGEGENEALAEQMPKEVSPQLQAQEEETGIDWDCLYKHCPVVTPVMNDRTTRYLRIMPVDLKYLPMQNWFLGRNSFLLHGYYNYRYLILGRSEQGVVLGIPGLYSPMEARVAAMFGFPYFERAVPDRGGEHMFGYWCRTITDD